MMKLHNPTAKVNGIQRAEYFCLGACGKFHGVCVWIVRHVADVSCNNYYQEEHHH